MGIRHLGALVAAGMASLGLAGPAASDQPDPRSARILDAILAEGLAKRGETEKDPVLLLAAARLLSGIRAPEDAAPEARTPVTLARRAASLAPQDAAIAALALRMEPARAKGLETGPLHIIRLIQPGAADTQADLQFEPGKEAEVYLHGDGSGSLELEVSLKGGSTVCRSKGPSDKALCRFIPLAATYAVHVRNTGNSANRFRLLTN